MPNCRSCGQPFFTLDRSVTECQNCTGIGLPKPVEKPAREPKASKPQSVDIKAVAAAVDGTDGTQTVDLSALAEGSTDKPKRRRTRKPKTHPVATPVGQEPRPEGDDETLQEIQGE